MSNDTSRISPTAHYTGYVWCRNELSPPELATTTGRAMFHALRGPMRLASLASGGLTLEKLLLQRHLIIDHLLDEAIRAGRVTQVLEIAAGLSGRGRRFTNRHPSLRYIEGDLPGMAARKRARLEQLGPVSPEHHVETLNALVDDGPESIFAIAERRLDPDGGTAIITEGLLSYFPKHLVIPMLQRFARVLSGHGSGVFLCDLHFDDSAHHIATIRAFRGLLGLFAQANVTLHFPSQAHATVDLLYAGFSAVDHYRPRDLEGKLELPSGWRPIDYVNIACATTGPSFNVASR